MSKENQLIIFSKNLVFGTVKTRIGHIKGHDIAMYIYQKLVQHTAKVSADLQANKWVYFTQFIPEKSSFHSDLFHYKIQANGDLGFKMQVAFNEILPKGPSVIIGSDCADISSKVLKEAYQKLEEVDIVIGPAQDGGYYLLGMKEPHDFLFKNMPWSTPQLADMTINKIKDAGLSFSILETLSDIDYWEDWIEYLKKSGKTI